jgi:flagellar protein FlgJ
MSTSALAMTPATGIAALNAAAGATATPQSDSKAADLAKAAKAFEAIFVRQLMGAMRSAGFGDDLTGSSAVDQFQDMSDANTAQTLAERGGLGIAEMLLGQLGGRAKSAAPDDAGDTARVFGLEAYKGAAQ